MSASYAYNSKQIAEFYSRLIQAVPSLPSDVMQVWIENPKAFARAIEQALSEPSFKSFPTWKTVTVGLLKDQKAAFQALRDAGINRYQFNGFANELFVFKKSKSMFNLVQVTLKDLGLKTSSTTDLFSRAEQNGLSLCPPEVAFQLWLQYPTLLAKGEKVLIATDLIVDVYGQEFLFKLANIHDDRMVMAHHTSLEQSWDNTSHWVFVRS